MTQQTQQVDTENINKTANLFNVISITSGKGGVGKTLTTVNLAIAARAMGHKVLVLDGDLGLSNVDVVLGLQARYNINDVLNNDAELKDIILDGPMGIKIIPSGSGVARLNNLSVIQRLQILEQIEKLEENFDVLLIDTGAGISDNVLHFNSISDTCMVITTPEPHAMTDAYAVIKVLSENYRKKSFKLLVNMSSSDKEALKIATRIAEVSKRFLSTAVEYVGRVPFDPQVQKSVLMRQAASHQSTYTVAGQAWNKVAENLFDRSNLVFRGNNSLQIWQDLLWSKPDPQALRKESKL